jgi:hypothetical protein
LALAFLGAGPARGDIIAQYALGGTTGETSMTTGPGAMNGRTGMGWEATDFDPNVTASAISLSDSIPPSGEEYIEITSPSYVDANNNMFPVLRLEPGGNSITPAEAVQKDKYFAFTVTGNSGVLNLTNLTFDAARGGTGGGTMSRGYAVLSSVDGFSHIIDTQFVENVRPDLMNFKLDLSGPSYQGLTTVTIRVYAFVGGGGYSVEFSNVTLNGKVQ